MIQWGWDYTIIHGTLYVHGTTSQSPLFEGGLHSRIFFQYLSMTLTCSNKKTQQRVVGGVMANISRPCDTTFKPWLNLQTNKSVTFQYDFLVKTKNYL